jgi:hypothetical protein
MPELRFTLIGEGPTDDALMPIIVWLLEDPSLGLLPEVEINPRFVDRDQFPGAYGLDDRIVEVLRDLPSDLIFVHQDADGPTHVTRVREIRSAVLNAGQRTTGMPAAVPVVPVREMEAWLLLDESAIRRVVHSPGGTVPLGLPHVRAIEACQDPKVTLREALRIASGLPRRRWRQVDRIRPRAIADQIRDFSPLRQLPAFQAFEKDVRDVIQDQGWPERLG